MENWIESTEGKDFKEKYKKQIGYEPSLKELEVRILRQPEVDKNIHLLSSPGSIAELADFNTSQTVCQKCKVFVSSKYKNQQSYIQDVLTRIGGNGGKVFWYENEEDLISNVEKALKPNRIVKAEKNRSSF